MLSSESGGGGREEDFEILPRGEDLQRAWIIATVAAGSWVGHGLINTKIVTMARQHLYMTEYIGLQVSVGFVSRFRQALCVCLEVFSVYVH